LAADTNHSNFAFSKALLEYVFWLQHMAYSWIQPHFLTILIALSVLPSALWGGPFVTATMAILAILSFFLTRSRVKEVETLKESNRSLHEQLTRTQKLCSVDELSAGIAHEINNPLGIMAQEIQWIAHLLKKVPSGDVQERTDLTESLGVISQQIDRCKEIVNKLLSVAREMKPVIQRVDVNDLIERITVIVEKDAHIKKIRISKKFQQAPPPVHSDPPLLRQVILNLLVNATQAIETEGEITVSTQSLDGKSVVITVEDTGCGIPGEILDKIFTPFFSTKPPGQGTGMGLALCRGIIERLEGSISVNSELGKCTAFTIRLPAEGGQAGAAR
jgi:two-component system, NtrC family, sensor kinase